MIRTLRGRFDWRWLVAVALAAAVPAVLGVFTALRAGDNGSPPLARVAPEAAAVGPNGEPQIVAPDPAVEFPAVLSNLPNPPSHLAVDPKTGDLWFLIFTYDGRSNVLYHYSPAYGSVETFHIPSSSGSELYSAIAVDSRGHIISAEGDVVTDFDPSTGKFTQVKLPEPAVERVPYSPSDGPWILDMALADDLLAYLSRMNIPAITELDLRTGKAREIPYPASFGPAYEIALGRDGLWATSRWDIVGVSAAKTWRIDLASDESIAVGPGATALAEAPGEDVLGVRASSAQAPVPELVLASASGLVPVTFASEGQRSGAMTGLGIRDFVAIDSSTGATWVTGEGSRSVLLISSGAAAIREYRLPVYEGFVPICGYPCNWPDGELRTAVHGLAVAPNGDLYFSDATMNRIGVIHAGR